MHSFYFNFLWNRPYAAISCDERMLQQVELKTRKIYVTEEIAIAEGCVLIVVPRPFNAHLHEFFFLGFFWKNGKVERFDIEPLHKLTPMTSLNYMVSHAMHSISSITILINPAVCWLWKFVQLTNDERAISFCSLHNQCLGFLKTELRWSSTLPQCKSRKMRRPC